MFFGRIILKRLDYALPISTRDWLEIVIHLIVKFEYLQNSIETWEKSFLFRKFCKKIKEKSLVHFDYQNLNSICSRHQYVNTSYFFCVPIELPKYGS